MLLCKKQKLHILFHTRNVIQLFPAPIIVNESNSGMQIVNIWAYKGHAVCLSAIFCSEDKIWPWKILQSGKEWFHKATKHVT